MSTGTPDQIPADLPGGQDNQLHKDAHIAPVRASVVVIAPMDRQRELETVLQREMRLRGIGGKALLSLNSTACGQDPRKEVISIAYTRKGLPIPAFLSHSAAEDGALVVADGGSSSRDVVCVQPLLPVDGTATVDNSRLESLVYIPLNLLVSRPTTTNHTATSMSILGNNDPPTFYLSQSTDNAASVPSPSLPPLMGAIPPLQHVPSQSPTHATSMRVEVPSVSVSAASLPWRTITRDPTAVPTRTVDPNPTKRLAPHPHHLLSSSDSRQTRTSLRNWRSEKARGIQTPEVAASNLPSVEKMRAEKAARDNLRGKGNNSMTFQPQPCKK
eukprot:GFYU01019962.1.p1 GENE.GFYU01019962.1~~GFYU01019962.1.p1  ORF type:complete len:367 (-),score=-40.46 GFYU01019962.1:29-1015(-)